MRIIILMLGLLLISGCTTTIETIIYNNSTVIKYINTTTTNIEYINTTEECVCPDAAYMSRLLRDYERCNAEMKYFNETDLKDLSYDLNVSLTRCNEKVESLKDLI